MLSRALLVWSVLLVVAIVNGGMRATWIIPVAGDVRGRAISTLMLSAAIFALAWLTIEWMHPASARQAALIGSIWLLLTLAFEFLGGHFLFGQPWAALFEDYNLWRGRIWVLVLLVTALAPYLTAVLRGVFHRAV